MPYAICCLPFVVLKMEGADFLPLEAACLREDGKPHTTMIDENNLRN
jgi:hypothetical protein